MALAWLVNSIGKQHQHCPVDKAQEMNIKDIKVTYRSEGPNIKWKFPKNYILPFASFEVSQLISKSSSEH